MVRFTLLADGSSDKTLVDIIKWLLSFHLPTVPVAGKFADLRNRRTVTLEDRIREAIDLEPCDILFIHRDAESTKDIDNTIRQRKSEIATAISNQGCRYVPVVPVKMMETWLLTDESAIIKASGNRNATVTLPDLKKLESISDPKEQLHSMLKTASGFQARRLQKFEVHSAVHLVAQYTADFSKLRQLRAFQIFEADLVATLNDMGYSQINA